MPAQSGAGATSRGSLPQPKRLLAAAGYTVILLILAQALHGTFWPPFGLSGLWFYAAFGALLLGEFITEPLFTRPADALANAIALTVASASVSFGDAQVEHSPALAGRLFFMIYGALVVLLASLAIAFKDREGPAKRFAESATTIVGHIGRA